MEYEVTVRSGEGVMLKFVINADSAGTALQVAAARERALSKASKPARGQAK